MRQAARYSIIDKAYPRATVEVPKTPILYEEVNIEEFPELTVEDTFKSLDTKSPNVQMIDKFGGTFNSAFSTARRHGLREFE